MYLATVGSMPTIPIQILRRRGLAATAPAVAAGLLLAACGSSSHTSAPTHTTSASAKSTKPPPAGSALAAGVTEAMAHSQPQLKGVKAQCPSSTRWPVTCHFTATQAVTHPKKTLHMAGTITVTGASGGSYSYGLNYAPTN